jgi:hypothetical protein
VGEQRRGSKKRRRRRSWREAVAVGAFEGGGTEEG